MDMRRGREPQKKEEKEKLPEWGVDGCGGDSGEIRKVGNHLYFYAPIMNGPVATLVDTLHTMANEQLKAAIEHGGKPQPIILHLNSPGGSIFAGVAAMDAVRLCPVPVHAVVDGMCASAATFPFMVAAKRSMQASAYMLIHQLSSMYWGKYEELKDDMSNASLFMKQIRKVYLKHTKIKRRQLDRILKHDLWFDAKKCRKLGMVDEIL